MSNFCSSHRLPLAGVDPIDSAEFALALLDGLIDERRHQTVALLLDHEHRGLGVFSVVGTDHPDSIFEIIDRLVDNAGRCEEFGAVVLATVRPGGTVEPGDVARWMEISDQLQDAGLELVEWFLVGRRIWCPRDSLGEPPRWVA